MYFPALRSPFLACFLNSFLPPFTNTFVALLTVDTALSSLIALTLLPIAPVNAPKPVATTASKIFSPVVRLASPQFDEMLSIREVAAPTIAPPTFGNPAPATAPQIPLTTTFPISTLPPSCNCVITEVATLTAAPATAPINHANSPVGSIPMIGLFSQYANILALRKPLASVVAKVSALMNRQLAKS